MSRCFPFPPPGYTSKCSSNDALILSIKLQKESEKAKSSDKKKDRKREKKEKKKEKAKEKSSFAVDGEKQRFSDKLRKVDNCIVEPEGKSILQDNESNLLERSSLTEEHGWPIVSQNVSCSTDSTGNSSKRKKHLSPTSGVQSSGIRIRFSSSKKGDEPSTSASKEQEFVMLPQKREDHSTSYGKVRPCSSRLTTESSIKQDTTLKVLDVSHSASTSRATALLVPTDDKQEKKIESLPPKEKLSSHDDKFQGMMPLQKLSSRDKKIWKRGALYDKLFKNFVPTALECNIVADEDDNEEWLFGKRDENRPAKRLRGCSDFQSCGSNLPCSTSAVLQPRGHFLPDAGIHALPFTVPF